MNEFFQAIGETLLKDSKLCNNVIFKATVDNAYKSISESKTDIENLTILENALSSFHQLLPSDSLNTVIGAINQKLDDIKSSDINYIVKKHGSMFSIQEAVDTLKSDKDVASDPNLTAKLEEIAKAASNAIFQFNFIPALQATLKGAPQYNAVKEAIDSSAKYFNDNFARIQTINAVEYLKSAPMASLFKKQIDTLNSYIKEAKIVVDNMDADLTRIGHTNITTQLVQAIREHNKAYFLDKDFGTGNQNVVVSNYIGTCVNENDCTVLYAAPNYLIKTKKDLDFGKKVCEGLYVADAIAVMHKLPKAHNSTNLFNSVNFIQESHRLFTRSQNTTIEINNKNEFRINESIVKNIEDYRKVNYSINESSQTKDLLYAFVNNLSNVNVTPDIKIIRDIKTNNKVTVIREASEYVVQENNGTLIKLNAIKLIDYIKEHFNYDISDAFQIEVNNKKNKLAKIEEARAEKRELIVAMNEEKAKLDDAIKGGTDLLILEHIKKNMVMIDGIVETLNNEITLLNEEYNDVMTGNDGSSEEEGGQATSADDDSQTTDNANGAEVNECAEALIKEMQAEGALPMTLGDAERKAIEGLCGINLTKEQIIKALGYAYTGEPQKVQEGFMDTIKGAFDLDVALLGLKYISREQIEQKLKAIQEEIASDPNIASNPEKHQRLIAKSLIFAQALTDQPITVDLFTGIVDDVLKKSDATAIAEGLSPKDKEDYEAYLASGKASPIIKQSVAAREELKATAKEAAPVFKENRDMVDKLIAAQKELLEFLRTSIDKNNAEINKLGEKFRSGGLNESISEIGYDILDELTPEQLKQLEGDIAGLVQGGAEGGEIQGNAQEVLGAIKSKLGEDEGAQEGGEGGTQQAIIEGLSAKYNGVAEKFKSLNINEGQILGMVSKLKSDIIAKYGSINENMMDDQIIDNMNMVADSGIQAGVQGGSDEFRKHIEAAYKGEANKVGRTLDKLKEDGVNIGDENKVKDMLTMIFAMNDELDVEEASENIAKLLGQGAKHEAGETKAQEATEKKSENEPEHEEGDKDDFKFGKAQKEEAQPEVQKDENEGNGEDEDKAQAQEEPKKD